MNDLAIRFANVSMKAAITLAYREENPIFEDARELRGFKDEKFTSWCRHVYHSIGDNPQVPSKFLTRETIKKIGKRLREDPQNIEKLTTCCEKVEAYLSKYRRHFSLANGDSIGYPGEKNLSTEWRKSSM